ncbi:MAG: hypothetical protein Q8N94_10525 [Methanoregula sp.]|nr:hypothetical protein [Methanoregula sp.]
MSEEQPSVPVLIRPSDNPASRSGLLRLLVFPFAIYSVWMIVTALFEGDLRLFLSADPRGIIVYTVFACIITGMILPVYCIRESFITGAVNMFQIGFWPVRRTFYACALTTFFGYMAMRLFSPFGTDTSAFGYAFLLLLPTAIASVMVCWVLLGTHVQAFVRGGGTVISISAGSLITAWLFCITSFVHSPPVHLQPALAGFLVLGLAAAVFFFAIRDVYATSIFVAFGLTFVMADRIGVSGMQAAIPVLYGSALLGIITLIGIHLYFVRNFRTVKLPV